MTTEAIEPEVLPEIIPVTELEKINATDAGLATLRQKAEDLAAVGVPHKAAYEEIHALTMVAVKVRTGAMAIAKTLAAPHKLTYDAIIDEGKRIAAHAQATEQIVRPLKEAYEIEQERIKEEAARAEAARIAARIDSLYQLGATFDGLTYNVFGVLIDAVEAKALPDEEWMELYDAANSAYNGEQLRLAIDESERQAEAARLEQQKREQQAERLRLQAVADEQARLASELQAKQDAFDKQQRDAENARLQAVADEQARLKKIEDDANYEQLKIESARLQDEKEARIVQEEKARQKADKERSKRLAPEKKDFANYLDTCCRYTETLNYEQPEIVELVRQFNGRMQMVHDAIRAELESL